MPGLLTERIREGQKRKGLLDIWKGLLTGFNNNPDNAAMFSDKTLYDKSMIYKSLKDAYTFPYRAMRGEVGKPWADEDGNIHSGDAEMMEQANNFAGMAQLGGIPGGARGPGSVGMTVYHGSPHKFAKFDMSKIGTGEGAQAYGHGLYLAQGKKVADKYAGKLSQKVIEIPGFTPNTPVEHDLIASLTGRANTTQYGGGASAALDDLRNVANIGKGERKEAAQKMLSAMGDYGSPVLTDTGHLYKVDIPDEAVSRMLDWDKPLSEQAPEVRAALKANPNYEQYWLPHLENRFGERGENPSVADLHNYLKDDYMPDEIAELFKGQGIPGIRYLDGGSRTAGEGTSNFVLFDDQLPRIIERNGEATGLQPWQPGEANNLLGLPPAAPSRPRNALDQNWTRPKLSDFNGDRLRLEDAQSAINEKMMLSFIDSLKQIGIKPESPGLSAGLGQEFTPWTNGIGGRSIYTRVPGYGTVRFSDHPARATNTFATPEEALNAIKSVFDDNAARHKGYEQVREMLGLQDVGEKQNLKTIQEYLSKNPQTGAAKDPGYWANIAGLDTTKPGGWGFYKRQTNPFDTSQANRPVNALGQEPPPTQAGLLSSMYPYEDR